MRLNTEQYQEFEKIRKYMSDWIQSYNDEAETVEDSNNIYIRKALRHIDKLVIQHCHKNNQAHMRLWCIKYWNL